MDYDDELAVLGAADYAVFAVMLVLSAAIGFYFAYKDRKAKEGVQGYLLAERQMSFIPVAVSLSLSFVSAVTVLGAPAEIHYFGSMYVWLFLAVFWVTPVVAEIYIPMFYRLRISSAFEYIQLRFNRLLRLTCTFIYIVQNIMYIGIMIYAPALALSSVTNFSLWVAIVSVGAVCTLYTTLGGLKAVIWTDVFQGAVLIVVVLVVIFKCAAAVGGFDEVWAACYRGGRIDFIHFETDPRIRSTFWSMSVGLGFLWLTVFGTSQSQVQRYLSCKTELEAKKGVYAGIFIASLCLGLVLITGFISYAYFETCDPLVSGRISAADQLVPYMVLRIFKNEAGLPGLFMAGLFAGCLSTVSSGINAMACVTVKDFIQPFVEKSPGFMTVLSKGLVFMYGAVCIGFAFLASALGGILQASLSVLGLLGGPLLGVFSLGMTFPCANSQGGGAGIIAGIALTTWIFVGSTVYPPAREFTRPLPLDISGCNLGNTSNTTQYSVNTTTVPTVDVTFNYNVTTDATSPVPAVADLYAVSYAYYAAIGYGTTMIVGLIVSLLTCGHRQRKQVDPALIVPMLDHKLLRWLPSQFRRWMWCGVAHDKVKDAENEDISVAEKYDVTLGESGIFSQTSAIPTVTGSIQTPSEETSKHEDCDEISDDATVKANSQHSNANGQFNQAFAMEEEASYL